MKSIQNILPSADCVSRHEIVGPGQLDTLLARDERHRHLLQNVGRFIGVFRSHAPADCHAFLFLSIDKVIGFLDVI